jgi:alpha-beta hydrolase superfamily lysophospholipase
MDRGNFKRLLVGDLSVKRAVRSVILIALFVYVGLFVYARMFGNRIIFQPPPPSYQDSNEVIKLSSGGVPISAIHLKNSSATYTILYSHGNAEDLATLRATLERIREMGFSVFAYDYRGYGTSAGASSEKTTYEDIDAAYEYLIRNQKVPPNCIIALGRSLGGAIAVDLASRKPLGGLVIESSFVSAYRVLTRFPIYPFDQFKSITKIGGVHCPVLVIHGRNDEVIPFWHGQKLFRGASEPKVSYWVDGAGHNNLFEVAGPGYAEALRKLTVIVDKRNASHSFSACPANGL